MAPIISILIRLLPSLPGSPPKSQHSKASTLEHANILNEIQQPIPQSSHHQPKSHLFASESSTISAITWGVNRNDVFGLTENNLTHKWWDGSQWAPSSSDLETLGNGLASPPVAITWGPARLDIFGLDDNAVIKHQYYDGTAWQPGLNTLENLGGPSDPELPISAVTWGEGRLDVFSTGTDGALRHQYYDGSQWKPDQGSLESLGGSLTSGPSAVSWGKDRLDVFAIDYHGHLAHLYWEGGKWSDWESFVDEPVFSDAPTVTSWGEGRLDIYAVGDDGIVYHKYYGGGQWSGWEDFGSPFQGSVGAVSWSANRIDLVAFGTDSSYYYKYWNGESWQPDVKGWYNKGGDFRSSPAVTAWGANRLDIFGVVDGDKSLGHQTWYGDGWYPGPNVWESLGGPLALVESETDLSGRNELRV